MTKKITYLYFDDTPETATPVKDNLDSDHLIINIQRESAWADILSYLLDHESEFDGLILDWRLDGGDGSKADFTSEALAQQCRRLQVDKKYKRYFSKSFPIILCSAQPGFKLIHEKDTSGEDLFDGVFEKSELEDEGGFLVSLVEAYRKLSEAEVSLQDIIGLNNSDQKKINNSLIRKIEEIKVKQPHEMVQFLLREVLNLKGALINENILASRLGVDIESKGWEELKAKMDGFIYKGILQSENRWWADLLNDWWMENFEGSTLMFFNAAERLKCLKSRFDDLHEPLLEPKLSLGAISTEFWTVCYATKVPLAEVDGFILDKHLHYPWQEKEFICLEEAKNESLRGELWFNLLPHEEERLKSYFDDETN